MGTGARGPEARGQGPGFPHCFQGPGARGPGFQESGDQAFRDSGRESGARASALLPCFQGTGGQVPGCVSVSIIYILPAVKYASSKLPFFGVFCLPIQICLLGVRGPGPGLPALLPGVRCPGFQGFRGPCGQTSRLSGGFQRARLPPGARGQGPEGQGPASLVFFRICSYHFIFYF